MSKITDYKIVSIIYESANSLVYRAKSRDQRSVILKVLKQDYPTPSELTRYKQEYEITRSLNIDGAIAAYELLPYENTLAIVLEDFGAQSLDILLQSQSFSLLEFLQIGIQVAQALAEIHGSNIIHKDFNPANILFNPDTRQAKIIDFGIATIFTRENPVIKNPNVLEGTLAYMSPEQTGRMNRALDYRTDFYSLGATFYKILTRQLLFDTQDALELVHCHLAREPIPPHQIDSSIPTAISRIVMKLLAKTAEDRYQSALGVKADLEECYFQLEQTGEIAEFSLARYDLVEQLEIPQKLYGRNLEIEELLATFRRVSQPKIQEEQTEITTAQNRVEMMLVGGYSGIGKTALIQELYKPLSQQRGYFIAGKFDQFQRNIPYSALVDAFRSLVRQLLTENQDQLNEWREKLEIALGINGQVIVDVIPEIEQIIGSQPPIQPLEPAQAQNRFNQVFQNFIRVFCKRSHPLIFFLDDLQWADFGTLKLIELMMTDSQIESLLLLGAYRDNEVDDNHPTILAIERLKEQGTIVNQIILTPLKSDDITQLLTETLHCDRESVASLTELILQKTSGNPFFINEFLKTIYEETLLTLNRDCQCWEWDISQIQALDITDNVVDLMLGKLRKLPEATQAVLRLGACIGNNFDLSPLSIIYEKSPSETFEDILPAIQQGLVQPTSELEITSKIPIQSDLVIQNYKFRHDRIQQAAYTLIDRDLRKIVHLQIGRLLLANWERDEQHEKIFTLVNHLNRGLTIIEDREEKIEILELNLDAGKKAKEAIAYSAAQDYLRIALNEFPGDIWEERYEMALDLYKELVEVEYLNVNFQESQKLLKVAIERVKSPLDSAEFYYLQIVQSTLQGNVKEAIDLGRVALQILGSKLPKENFYTAFEQELVAYRKNLGNRSIGELYNNSEMKRLEQRAIFKILSRIFPAAWILDPTLMYVVGSKMVNLNIKYGHIPLSPMGYIFFGVINTHALKEYRTGYEFGLLSMKLSDRYNNLASKGVACQLHGNMTMPWLAHIKFSEKINDEGRDASLQVGDLQVVGYTLTYKIYSLIYQGKNLEILLKEAERSLHFSQETQNDWAINCILAAKIVLKNLVGESQDKLCFDLEELPESDFLQTQIMAAICFYQIFKVQALYLYEQPAPLSLLEESAKLLGYIPATISVASHNFYYSLTLIAHYPNASPQAQKEYWHQIETNQKQMKDWADNCEANFLHKYLLVAAEMARISGKWQEAMTLYDSAIASAKEHEFIQNEALGNELAAQFWLALGKEEFAKLYMRKARQCYQIWGAKRKVEDLEEKYPQWFTSPSSESDNVTKTAITTTSGHSAKSLDIETVIKASETLSKEIVLKNLLANLMKIAIANAGAQKGFLILKKDENWFIEAEGNVDEEEAKLLQSIPIDSPNLLSPAIANYVIHSQETVLLNDAVNEGQYIRDSYIIANQPKSILCIPLINQGKLSGILYLENNLTTNAFTRERIELLQTLSAQAAISIENSRLYQELAEYNRTLEDKVAERTQELQEKNEELSTTLHKLKTTQNQIIAQEKLASLGALTAGIAHEIKNPLNFVNNFAQLSVDLTQELQDEINNQQENLDSETVEYIEEILTDLRQNVERINHHGKRADNIVHGMMMHAQGGGGKREPTKINNLLAEFVNLAYHGMRAKDEAFNIIIESDYDESVGEITLVPQDISRVFLNLTNNACYAAYKKQKQLASEESEEISENESLTITNDEGEKFEPMLWVSTKNLGDRVEIRIRDNGVGMPPDVVEKIFNPFFTTKPTGEGTGLGLSISHDIIVQGHQGEIKVETEVGSYAEFIVILPR
ncbi:trifunctional serine/threonine-protein kinase/ATP-binding protein/sensor histidine kinase [Limnofasciculus baicalensis]|uniref:histidine kinase n=1 Tax=Limnofasciculus baicalensis BBK-W-15 TaxID=2699891 RepID=A0AAE3GPL0_9CYAN|nr:ATP-binding sensor histidine kinase [Limnofasciculus baicalensis]MCP2727722.1 AAA family ATPase [Limnofasciculus baicalensis BBK-W-15]